jgi:SAM-dependent methyltransferase
LADYKFKSTTPLPEYIIQNIGKNAKILDVGCGDGRVINYLRKQGFVNVSGIDPLHENKPLRITKTDFEEFKTNEKYDVIIFMGLMSILKKEKRRAFIQKAIGLLEEHGILFFEDFGLTFNMRNLKRYLSNFNYLEFGTFNMQGLEIHHFSKPELKQLFNGLNLLVFEKMSFKTMHGNKCNGYLIVGEKNGD